MKFIERLYALYLLFPYIKKPSFMLSIMLSSKVNLLGYKIPVTDYDTMIHLLSVKRFSQKFTKSNNGIDVSFDNENEFHISQDLNNTDKTLLLLLDQGIKDGAYFIDENHSIGDYNKTIRIIQSSGIVETFDDVTYHLDHVGAMPEIFIRRIHDFYSDNLDGKIVVDLGASVGDTPLYFASRGATVYAVEMTKTNYDSMLKNIELNPHLAKKIIPIHAAFGKDGTIEYYQDSLSRSHTHGGASFVKNKYGEHGKKNSVQGMSLDTLRKKYNLESIDLLKIDCKGGEFFLKENELKNINKVKIEYYSLIPEHRVSDLMKTLKNFKTIIFKHTPNDTSSLLKHGNILGISKSV